MTDPVTVETSSGPKRTFGPPPFLQRLGKTDPVRTPLGHYRTESLFLEQWRPMETARPVYTLQREDREDPRVPGSILPSFQKRYIELGDPTGYKAAIDLLGSWQHWGKLAKTPWFKEHLNTWNEEVIAALHSRGLDTFVRQADKGDLKAAEWLVGYTPEGPRERTKRGRPSKAEVLREARTQAERDKDMANDAARVGLGS